MDLSKLRHTSFWIADSAYGGKIKSHLKEIDDVLNDPVSEYALKIQRENLKALLDHAIKSTNFYRKFENSENLEDFPVITKTDVQNNFEAFKSDAFDNVKLHSVATSGSTGVPFFLFQDENKRYRNIADVYYFLNAVGHNLGERLYELEIWREHNQKSGLKSWIQNVVQFDVSKLTPERIETLLEDVYNHKYKKTFLGFASALETICKHLDSKSNIHKIPKIDIIIANSEYLNDYTHQSLKKHFDANVYSRYSNEEIGIIAHQTSDSKTEFKINWASYFVELLDLESDNPAKEGALGRIVVTDLFNYAMPLIRYDTGDIGRFSKSRHVRPNFEHIEGRKMDLIYDTKGNALSSFIVYTKFYKYYGDLNQYQFVQTGSKDYTINLNINDTFLFEQELIEDIKSDFGQDANIKICYVEEIPPLASGKRKKVVNTYHKN